MTIPVKQNLVSPSKYNIKCPYPMTAEYITVHNTYNDASAENEIKYMISNNNEVSFHVAIDDVQIIQGILFNRNAWACGDGGNGTGNRKSISVEICYSKSGGERYKKAEALAIKFIAQLLKEHGWGMDRVRKHQDWSGKYCPHRILDEGRWSSFVSAIATELACLNVVPKATAAPTLPPGIIGQVKVIVDGLYAVVKADQNGIEVAQLEKGKVYNVTQNVHDYHKIILNDHIQVWMHGSNGHNLELVR